MDGYLFVPPGESSDILDREMAVAQHAGLSYVHMLARPPITSFDTGRTLCFPRQAQFRSAARKVSSVSSFGRHRSVEPFRKNVGLPLSRITIRYVWKSGQWAGYFKSIPRRRPSGALKLQKLIHPILSNIDQLLSGSSSIL